MQCSLFDSCQNCTASRKDLSMLLMSTLGSFWLCRSGSPMESPESNRSSTVSSSPDSARTYIMAAPPSYLWCSPRLHPGPSPILLCHWLGPKPLSDWSRHYECFKIHKWFDKFWFALYLMWLGSPANILTHALVLLFAANSLSTPFCCQLAFNSTTMQMD